MKKTIIYCHFILLFLSCSNDILVKNNPENVFHAFWESMNNHYVNFDVKHVDWDSVYQAYYPKVRTMKTNTELIPIFQEILDLLEDQHIVIALNYKNYIQSSIVDTMPNENQNGENYKFRRIEPFSQQDGFSLYQSELRDYIQINLFGFYSTFNTSLLKSEIKKLNYSNGIIIDVRDNSGGYAKFPLEILSWFYKGKKTLFFQSFKQSLAKNDFSYQKPFVYSGIGIIPESVPLVLLTNSGTYSAANFFAYIASEFPNCITVGLPTSGGDGPIHTELLPNGWTLTYPYFRNYSLQGIRFEESLYPDYYIVNHNAFFHDEQFIKALCLLDSINKFPYVDYKRIWNQN